MRKRSWTTLLKLTVSLTLIAIFFVRLDVDVEHLFNEWRSVERLRLLLAVIVFFTSNLLGAVQWHLLLKAQGISLRLPRIVASYLVGLFFNNFTVGNIAGDVFRVQDIRKVSGDGSAGFAATFLDRLLGFAALMSCAVMAYPAASASIDAHVRSPMLIITVVLGMIVALSFSRRVGRTLQRTVARWLPDRFANTMSRVVTSLALYRGKRRIVITAALIAITVQLLRIVSYFLVGLSLRMATPFHYFLLFLPLIATIAAIPISFGGLGVRENTTAIFFATVGIPTTTAWSLGFLGYLVGIASSLPGIIIFNLRPFRSAYEAR